MAQEKLPGTQGNIVTFVADDFVDKIRRSGKPVSDNDSESLMSESSSSPVDVELLNILERYTNQLSISFDKLLGKLTNDLHKASAISVGYAQTYNDATKAMGQDADSAVQSMYSLIAHSEELSKSMEPVHKVHSKIKNVKAVLAALEAQVT